MRLSARPAAPIWVRSRSPTNLRRCTRAAITTQPTTAWSIVWQWKASRGGHLGYVDDQYFAAPRRRRRPKPKARHAIRPATGTIRVALSTPTITKASRRAASGAGRGAAAPEGLAERPSRILVTSISIRIRSMRKARNGGCWKTKRAPYSKDSMPRFRSAPSCRASSSWANMRAIAPRCAAPPSGKTATGRSNSSRDLRTGSKFDHDFVAGRDLYMWLNVFDHTQTRHTRHQRPVRLVLEECKSDWPKLLRRKVLRHECQCELTINGKSIEAIPGETLIDAALGAWLIIPHDCRSGQCESCRVTVVSGDVDDNGTTDRTHGARLPGDRVRRARDSLRRVAGAGQKRAGLGHGVQAALAGNRGGGRRDRPGPRLSSRPICAFEICGIPGPGIQPDMPSGR